MGFCDSCLSAGSVNTYGYCEICGTEHDLADSISTVYEASNVFDTVSQADIAQAG